MKNKHAYQGPVIETMMNGGHEVLEQDNFSNVSDGGRSEVKLEIGVQSGLNLQGQSPRHVPLCSNTAAHFSYARCVKNACGRRLSAP
jgi:hypothetical protein